MPDFADNSPESGSEEEGHQPNLSEDQAASTPSSETSEIGAEVEAPEASEADLEGDAHAEDDPSGAWDEEDAEASEVSDDLPESATAEEAGRGIPGTEDGLASAASQTTGEWYAVRVQSNKELTVKRNMEQKVAMRGLQRKILQVEVPTEKVTEIKNGRKRTREVKTYPGYVLVEMAMDDETWAFVRETAGVGDFVGGGGGIHQKPFPLTQNDVNQLFGVDLPGAEPQAIRIDFGVGDKVKIKEGAFENFDGVVDDIDEIRGRVKVVVTIFGRATPVELNYWEVEVI